MPDRPPRLTDRRWFDAWLAAQPTAPADRWRAFQARDDLPATTFAFAASAVYSSNIEGISVDLASFLRSKTRGGAPPRTREEAEVTALEAAYAWARDHDPTEANGLEAHRRLSEHTLTEGRRGVYRTERMFVYGPMGIVYAAVEPEHVEHEMAAFYDDVQALRLSDLSPNQAVYHAALAHLVFAHIHPFADGNGRAARLLEKWILADALGPTAWAIPSEHFYWTHRPDYYAALRLGPTFYDLDYNAGGPSGDGATTFLSLLPSALDTD